MPEVPLADYATPSTPGVVEATSKYAKTHTVCLMEYHGAFTWGPDVWAAYMAMERLEYTAQITYLLERRDGLRELPDDEIVKLVSMPAIRVVIRRRCAADRNRCRRSRPRCPEQQSSEPGPREQWWPGPSESFDSVTVAPTEVIAILSEVLPDGSAVHASLVTSRYSSPIAGLTPFGSVANTGATPVYTSTT